MPCQHAYDLKLKDRAASVFADRWDVSACKKCGHRLSAAQAEAQFKGQSEALERAQGKR